MEKEILFKYFILTAVYSAFLILFWPFKSALLLAALFAMAATPVLNRWEKKIHKEKLIIFLLVFGLLFVVIAPLTLIVTKVILNISQLQQDSISQLPIYKNIESVISSSWQFLNNLSARFDFSLDFDIQSALPRVLQFIIPWLTASVAKFPQFLLQLFIFMVSLYFFLLKRREFLGWFEERKLLSKVSLGQLVNLLQKVCYTVVFSTIIVASVQAAIITLAASIAGFDNLMIIFILTFFMAFIPVVGSVPVSLTLAVYCFLQGETGNGVIMVCAMLFAGGIDNVIRAYILSAEEGALHPMISLITLIGALALFGVPGLFLGPIIAELAFAIGKIMNNSSAAELPQPYSSSSSESSSS